MKAFYAAGLALVSSHTFLSLSESFDQASYQGMPDHVMTEYLEQRDIHPELMSSFRDNNFLSLDLAAVETHLESPGNQTSSSQFLNSFNSPSSELAEFQYVYPGGDDFDWGRID